MAEQWDKYSQDNSEEKKRFTLLDIKTYQKDTVIKIVTVAQEQTNRPVEQSTGTDTHIDRNST